MIFSALRAAGDALVFADWLDTMGLHRRAKMVRVRVVKGDVKPLEKWSMSRTRRGRRTCSHSTALRRDGSPWVRIKSFSRHGKISQWQPGNQIFPGTKKCKQKPSRSRSNPPAVSLGIVGYASFRDAIIREISIRPLPADPLATLRDLRVTNWMTLDEARRNEGLDIDAHIARIRAEREEMERLGIPRPGETLVLPEGWDLTELTPATDSTSPTEGST